MKKLFGLIIMMALTGQMAVAQAISGGEIAALQMRAQNGSSKDQFMLGAMYEYGKSVPQDPALAASWYEKAANQEYVKAQIALGNLYDKGIGVPQSYADALFWYHKAADKGDPQAMYFIGSMIFSGEGLAADRKMAMAWFQRAAVRGFAPAKTAIADIERQTKPAGAPPGMTPNAVPSPAATGVLRASADQNIVPAPAKAIVAGKYAVQIGSFRTAEQAQTQWGRLQDQLPEGLVSTAPHIYKKTLDDARIFYRLNAGVFAQKNEANAQCATLKNSNIDCLIVKY